MCMNFELISFGFHLYPTPTCLGKKGYVVVVVGGCRDINGLNTDGYDIVDIVFVFIFLFKYGSVTDIGIRYEQIKSFQTGLKSNTRKLTTDGSAAPTLSCCSLCPDET